MSAADRAASIIAATGAVRMLLAVVVLSLLLLVSAGLNVRQWADHRAYVKSETERLNAAASKAGLQVAAKLAKDARKDRDEILEDLRGMAERSRTTRTVYAKAAKQTPLPKQCAPGKARMDAVNAGADR